jgi:hypothetical protein
MRKGITPEFVNMSKEILYPQIQGVTAPDPTTWTAQGEPRGQKG